MRNTSPHPWINNFKKNRVEFLCALGRSGTVGYHIYRFSVNGKNNPWGVFYIKRSGGLGSDLASSLEAKFEAM